MKKKKKKIFKLIKELPWLNQGTMIEFDIETEEIFILNEANWYIQPSDWQYEILEEIINSQKKWMVNWNSIKYLFNKLI